MSITFLYRNKIKESISITESSNDGSGDWGTSKLYDDDLNSAFRNDVFYFTAATGTTSILFNFGSAVYMDSVASILNLTPTGTCWLKAGTTSVCGDFTTGVPIDGLGTSYKYFGNQGYQYWKINLKGVTAIGQHQINELSLFKRTSIAEMPSYPFENNIEENTVDLISERGQKWVYSNYSRESWVMNFEGVGAITENDLFKMYKYCRKNTQPFWMLLDPDNNPLDVKFVRFRDGAFLSDEIVKNVFDITMELEKEI